MVCSHCLGAEKVFNEKHARRELKRYLRKGPMESTRQLIEALKTMVVKDRTLLDIGGGVGIIQLELLEAGASRSRDVDAAPDYIKVARAEASRRNLADRTEYRQGDFAEIADDVEDADIVTLDRVICCYPDMPRLVSRSAAKARKLYGAVFPRDRRLIRFAMPLMNAFLKLRRSTMRVYLHSPTEIDRLVREQGFTPAHESRTFLWQVAVYAKAA